MRRLKRCPSALLTRFLTIILCVTMVAVIPAAAADIDTQKGNFSNPLLSASYDASRLIEGVDTAEFVVDDSIKLTATGYRSIFSTKANTLYLYITNGADKKMTLSFTLDTSALNSGQYNLGGATDSDNDGVYEIAVEAGKSHTISVTSQAVKDAKSSITISNISLYRSSAMVTFNPMDTTIGSYSVGGNAISTATTIEYTKNTAISLPEVEGYSFAAWMICDANGNMTQTVFTTEEHFLPSDDVSIAPMYVPSGTALFSVDGVVYSSWQTAMAAAKANVDANGSSTVILLGSGVLSNSLTNNTPDGTYVRNDGTSTEPKLVYKLPAKVNFLIPYGGTDTGSFGPSPENYLSQVASHAYLDQGGIHARNFVYRSLKVETGAMIECYGSINLNARRQMDGQSFTGVPIGGYGKLILGDEHTGAPETDESALTSQLVIKSGGALYAYGYITGTGLVEAESGSVVHELIQIACWPGGGNAERWNGLGTSGNMLFMLTQYYVQNIEAPLRVAYGATHSVEAALTVSSGLLGTITKPESTVFISTDTAEKKGLFLLTDKSSYVLRIYNVEQDRMNYYLKGGKASIGTISVSITADLGISSENYVLPLNHNLSLIVCDGVEVTLDKKAALLPGAEITIDRGGKLNLDNLLFLYDKGDYTSSHFFHRATNLTVDASNTAPNHCPVPYVATLNNISPQATSIFAGVLVGSSSTTDTYYLDIKNITKSAKLTVNGTLNISTNGALLTTNNNSNTDKVVVGTGTIIHNGTFAANSLLVSYGNQNSSSETIVRTISTTPGLANIAGVGTLKAFASGTYYGQSNDYWYNWVVKADSANNLGKFTGIPSAATNGVTNNSVSRYNSTSKAQETVLNVLGLVSYYWNGTTSVQSTFNFKMDATDGSGLSVTGGGENIVVTPSLDVAELALTYGMTGVGADVTLGTTTGTFTTVTAVASNANYAPFYSVQISFPSCAKLGNFYSDQNCTNAASSAGGTVYAKAEAVAAIGSSEGNYAQAFMLVAEAVSKANSSNPYVTVLVDRTLTSAIVVAKGQNITLDLGGCTITGKSDNTAEPLTNYGTLRLKNGTITDSATYRLNSQGKGEMTQALVAATVRNAGIIEYIDNVTLEQMYSASVVYTCALMNNAGATIDYINRSVFETYDISNGVGILNFGTINTIGKDSDNTVTFFGRRGIIVGSGGTINTIGGAGSTVKITGGQRGIEVLKNGTVGTIGEANSTVEFYSGGMAMNKAGISSDGKITTIGGEGSMLIFEMTPVNSHEYYTYTLWFTSNAEITTIGAAGSNITINGRSAQTAYTKYRTHMYGIYNGGGTITNIGSKATEDYPASTLTINVAHSGSTGDACGVYNTGTIGNFGANGATINISSSYTGTDTSRSSYGIYNSGTITKFGTVCSSIEIVSNQHGIYNTKKIGEIRGDVVVISTDEGTDTTTGYFALYSTGTIQIYSGDYYHASDLRAKAVYLPDTAAYYPACHSLSTATHDVAVDGVETPYACYYIVTSHKWTSGCICETCNIIRFYGTNVNLGNNLDMMFAFPTTVFAAGTDLTNYYVEFVRADGTTTKVMFKDWAKLGISGTETVEGDEYYVVYHSFAAKEMCDTVTVTIYDDTGKVISISKTDSIQAYAKRMLDKTSNANLKDVIICMLNYGSACQVQFGYNTDSLANSVLDENSRLTYVAKTGSTITVDPNASTKNIAGHNLVVESNIKFYIAFNGVAENTEVEVSFTGHKNNEESYTAKVNNQGYIEITGLVVADHKSTISLKIGDTTLTTSIDAYISGMGEGETNNVFYAFNQFAAAAYTYQHPEEATA